MWVVLGGREAPAAVGLVGACASSGIVALENSLSQNEESVSSLINGGWVRPCVRRFVTTFSSLLDRETSVVHSRPQGAGGFVGAQVSRRSTLAAPH